jgi:hypothetical protein
VEKLTLPHYFYSIHWLTSPWRFHWNHRKIHEAAARCLAATATPPYASASSPSATTARSRRCIGCWGAHMGGLVGNGWENGECLVYYVIMDQIIMDYYELLWIILDYYGLLWIIKWIICLFPMFSTSPRFQMSDIVCHEFCKSRACQPRLSRSLQNRQAYCARHGYGLVFGSADKYLPSAPSPK